MLLDRVACRAVVSAASLRHCPAIDCSVAMSTFTGPPPFRVPPGAANARTAGAGASAVVHRRAPLSTDPAGAAHDGRSAGHDRAGDRPPSRPAGRAARPGWTLVGAEGAVDVEVTAARRRAAWATSCRRCGRALGRAGPGLWAGSARLADDLPLQLPGSATAQCSAWAARCRTRPARRARARWSCTSSVARTPGGSLPLGQGRHVLGPRQRGVRPARRPRRLPPARRRPGRRRGDHRGRPRVHQRQPARRRPSSTTSRGPGRPAAVLRLGASAVAVAGPGGASAASLEAGPGGPAAAPSHSPADAPAAEVEIAFPRRPRRRRAAAWPGSPSRCRPWVACSWPGSCTRRPSCSSLCSARSWRWAPGCPTAGPAGAADVGSRRPRAELARPQARLAAAVRADVRARGGRAPRPGHADRRGRATPLRAAVEPAGGDADALSVRLGTGPGPTGSPASRRTAPGARDRAARAGRRRPGVGGGLAVVGPAGTGARRPARGARPARRPARRRARSTCSCSPRRPARATGRGPAGCRTSPGAVTSGPSGAGDGPTTRRSAA